MTTSMKKLFSIICAVLLLLGFYLLRRNYGIMPTFTDCRFTITGSEGVSWSHDFSEISSIALIDQWEAGEVLSGGSKYGYTFGTRRNDSVGEYTIVTQNKIKDCFLMVTDQSGDVLIFNYESKNNTIELFSMLQQLFESEGYQVSFSRP